MRIILISICILCMCFYFFSCKSDLKKIQNENIKTENDTIIYNEQSLKDTFFSGGNLRYDELELKLINLIWNVPEIYNRVSEIYYSSKGKEYIKIKFIDKPNSNNNFYYIYLERNNKRPLLFFKIYPPYKDLIIFAPIENHEVPLKEWQKNPVFIKTR